MSKKVTIEEINARSKKEISEQVDIQTSIEYAEDKKGKKRISQATFIVNFSEDFKNVEGVSGGNPEEIIKDLKDGIRHHLEGNLSEYYIHTLPQKDYDRLMEELLEGLDDSNCHFCDEGEWE